MAGNPKSKGTLLLVIGIIVLAIALLVGVGWENVGHTIESASQSVIAFVGGGMQLLVILGVILVASGATVMAIHKH